MATNSPIHITHEGNTIPADLVEWTNSTNSTDSMRIRWDTTNTSSTCATNTASPPTPGTDGCNESLKHSNVEKAIFHAVKGAHRLVDEDQAWAALQIAGSAANAYLETEDEIYDPEHSEEYLYDEIVDDAKSTVEVIGAGIERAWNKIDSGHHLGGARVAVSVADAYLDAFEPARVE